MPQKFKPHRIRHTIATTALSLGLGLTASAHAAQVTFEFKGFVTQLSNSAAFGGVGLGEEISGTLSYDSSTAPNKTWGAWAATYTLQGAGTNLTFKLANGKQYQDTTLNARLVNGPVYPIASDDAFAINDGYPHSSSYVRSGETQSLHLEFRNTTGINGLSSANLPTDIDLSRLPFTGGTLQIFSGPEPTGDDIYVIDRRTNAFEDSPYGGGSYLGYPTYQSVTRYSRSQPEQAAYGFLIDGPYAGSTYPGSELDRYNKWLSAGNAPMYIDTLAFNMTSITTPLPEANSVLMLIAGAAIVGLARRRIR